MFSVILCTYLEKRINDTCEAIDSLLSQNYPDFEIIVVVDHNKKLFGIIKRKYMDTEKVTVMQNSTIKGLSGSRNVGISVAQGDVLAFFDDDAKADVNWLQNLQKEYERNKKAIGVGGPIFPQWVSPHRKTVPPEFFFTLGCFNNEQELSRRPIRSNFGSNTSFRKVVFNGQRFDPKYGRVEEKQSVGEESMLALDVLEKFPKKQIMFVPDAIVYHKVYEERQSLSHVLKRLFGYGNGLGQILFDQRYSGNLKKYRHERNPFIVLIFRPIQNRFVKNKKKKQYTYSILQFHMLIIGYFTITIGIIVGLFRFCFKSR